MGFTKLFLPSGAGVEMFSTRASSGSSMLSAGPFMSFDFYVFRNHNFSSTILNHLSLYPDGLYHLFFRNPFCHFFSSFRLQFFFLGLAFGIPQTVASAPSPCHQVHLIYV